MAARTINYLNKYSVVVGKLIASPRSNMHHSRVLVTNGIIIVQNSDNQSDQLPNNQSMLQPPIHPREFGYYYSSRPPSLKYIVNFLLRNNHYLYAYSITCGQWNIDFIWLWLYLMNSKTWIIKFDSMLYKNKKINTSSAVIVVSFNIW